jgi:hypothetical protein
MAGLIARTRRQPTSLLRLCRWVSSGRCSRRPRQPTNVERGPLCQQRGKRKRPWRCSPLSQRHQLSLAARGALELLWIRTQWADRGSGPAPVSRFGTAVGEVALAGDSVPRTASISASALTGRGDLSRHGAPARRVTSSAPRCPPPGDLLESRCARQEWLVSPVLRARSVCC